VRNYPIMRMVCGLCAVLWWVSLVGAETAVTVGSSPKDLMTDQLVLLARKCLRGQDQPTPAQLQAAAALLQQALPLAENNAEFLRLWAEVNDRLNRPQEVMAALKRYCNLRPADDAAQLELILKSLAQEQLLENRLAKVERILDSKNAEGLSAPLRSRLASFAAGAWRELGKTDKLDRRLAQALDLDSANLEAARLGYAVAVERQMSGREQGQAFLRVLRANPMDVALRRQLGEMLLSGGAYTAACRQFALAQTLAGGPLDDGFYQAWISALIAGNQLEEALSMLNALSQRDNAAKSGEVAGVSEKPNNPTATTQPDTAPASGRFPVDLEVLRLLVFHLQNQSRSVEASLSLLRQEFAKRTQAGDQQAATDALWLTVLCAPILPEVAELDKLAKQVGAEPGAKAGVVERRCQAWAALRRHDPRAAGLLAALAKEDVLGIYGQALEILKADVDSGKTMLAKVVKLEPTSLAGILAAQKLHALGGGKPEATEAGAALLEALQELPRFVCEPDLAQNSWVRLEIHPVSTNYTYLEPVQAVAVLRNATNVPLAIGSQGPISSRLFVYLEVRAAGQVVANLPPMVFDARQRLVLGANQALEIPLRLDWSEVGWLLGQNPLDRLILSGQAVLGPQGSIEGRVQVGPLGSKDFLEPIVRPGVFFAEETLNNYLAALDQPDLARQMEAVAWLCPVLARIQNSKDKALQEAASKITLAVTRTYQSMDPLLQAWTVHFLLPDAQKKPVLSTVHDLAQRSDNPLIQIVYLASQVDDPQSPLLDAALRHKDAAIAGFGQAWREVLRQTAKEQPVAAPPGSGHSSSDQ